MVNNFKREKVLCILHFPPPVHGASMVGQYIKDSKYINTSFACRYINLSTSKKVDEIGNTGLLKWLRFIHIIYLEIKNLIFYRPQLVYFTLTAKGVGFYKDTLLVLLAKLFGKKIIVHFHNKGVKTRQDFFIDNHLYKLVFKKSKVILLAPQLFNDIEKYVQQEQVYYCSNGIPEIDIIGKKNNNGNSEVNILFLSNLIISKGVLVLLQTCKILKERKLDFHCNIVGGAGDLSEVDVKDRIKKLGLDSHVTYLGKKYGEDKTQVYKNSDIFVLPTFYENECFPLVLLEAMQFGLPLVSTCEGGIPGIVDEGEIGYLVKRKDSVNLADRLAGLIMDKPKRELMGHKAKEKYKNEYTLETFEKNFKTILQKALS